ncbi:VOC family protein [Peribacillus glennii]|uniref:Glyoxalase n=1 Tax=Peribacillus glennii TaxID=2303991 RepID=A0A372LGR3_9BACI|nr:VOC family protein [Peribacillus glennii]RFU65269.1 glyoxalase [Peribacillus glennii]
MIKYQELHHVGLNVTNLEKAKRFYSDILCLQELERPNFDFDGAWYQIGRHQQLHLIVLPHSETIRSNKQLNTKEGHLALRVESFEETLRWLKENDVEVLENTKSVSGFAQIFCADPDGNLIELHVKQSNLNLG